MQRMRKKNNVHDDSDKNEEEINEENEPEDVTPILPVGIRKSKRRQKKNVRFTETIDAVHHYFVDSYQIDYFKVINSTERDDFSEGKVCCVGAGLGGGFDNTQDLKTMKYD